MSGKKDNKKYNLYEGQKFLVIGFLCFFCLCIWAQVKPTAPRPQRPQPTVVKAAPRLQKPIIHKGITAKAAPKKSYGPTNATPTKKGMEKRKKMVQGLARRNKGLTRIDLIHADLATEDNFAHPDQQILVGHVKLLHGHMYMFCDSAVIYKKTNSVDAFNHVKMTQGDTLHIFGNFLHYDGPTLIAKLRGDVKMVNRKTTLLTDSLDYDRLYNLAYYYEGGTVMDANNILTSDWGEYSPATKIARFNHSVKLVNPKFVLTTDTLKYSTKSKIATILGPSTIVGDKNIIHTKRGNYNTVRDQGWLFDRSVMRNGAKTLVGDSLFYNRKKSYGEAFHHVVMRDSLNKTMMTGNYCYYNEKKNTAFATRKALAIDYSQKDTMYMHADTLWTRTYNQKTDSMYRVMRAYHHVRMFRNDLQGVCDSLTYVSRDSCLTMYKDPIVWNEKQQLLGEVIKAFFNDSTITWAHIINQALTVEQMDSIHYNQVTSKEMKAYFAHKELQKVDAISNVRVVYYPVDDKDSTLMFMNTSETSLLNLYMKNKKLDKMVMSPQTSGVIYPMEQLPEEKMKLTEFAWFDYIRPKDKNDVFVWRPKKSGQQLKITREDSPDMKNKNLRDLLK